MSLSLLTFHGVLVYPSIAVEHAAIVFDAVTRVVIAKFAGFSVMINASLSW